MYRCSLYRWLVAVLIVLVSCGLSILLHIRTRAVTGAGGPLEVEAQYLAIGTVWEQEDYCVRLPIRNVTRTEVHVTRLLPSCSCTSIEPESFRIAPGSTETVELHIDVTRAAGKEVNGVLRPFSFLVTPIFASESRQHRPWIFRGMVRPSLSLKPAVLDFADSLVVGSPFPTRSVDVRAHVPLKSLRAECKDIIASAVVRKYANDASRFQVDVSVRKDAIPRVYDFKVLLHPTTEDNQILPPTPLRVMAQVVEDVQASPSAVIVGNVRAGTSKQETILIRSRTGSPVQLAELTSDSNEVDVSHSKENARSGAVQLRVRIEPDPMRERSHETTIHVRLTTSAGRSVALDIPVVYQIR